MVSNTISTAANFVGSWCGVCRGCRGVQGVQESDSVYVSKQPLLEFHFRYSQIVS